MSSSNETGSELFRVDNALIQQMQLSNLASPTPLDLKAFNSELQRDDFPLEGRDRLVWGNPLDEHNPTVPQTDEHDLGVLRPEYDRDMLSEFIASKAIPWYHNHFVKRQALKPIDEESQKHNVEKKEKKKVEKKEKKMREPPGTLTVYSKRTVFRVASGCVTLVACLLPTAAIVILYVCNTVPLRLGILSLLTAIFSLALMFLTMANRVEIFTATAA